MPDLAQSGAIATFHDVGTRSVDDLARDLRRWRHDCPMAVVIPSLASEFGRPALAGIVAELAAADHIDLVVLGLDQAGPDEVAEAHRLLSQLPQEHRVLWHDGPAFRAVDAHLTSLGLAPPRRGKGRNVWYCLGYLLARGDIAAAAVHDADLLTYDHGTVARLLYPLASPDLSHQFAKGYYYRAENGVLRGRVTRLLVTPLLQALGELPGAAPEVAFFESFRYLLAGEMALTIDLGARVRLPGDWGLEVGLLADVQRLVGSEAICQVDLGGPYDHKHQPLGGPSGGLGAMAIDITTTLLRRLAVAGVRLETDDLAPLADRYRTLAQPIARRFADDAAFNGLRVDEAGEREAISVFTTSVAEASARYLDEPPDTPLNPAWSRVVAAWPDVLPALVAAADDPSTEPGSCP